MKLVQRVAKMLAPDEMVGRITEVRPEALVKKGIQGLIVDLDNTLCRWQSEEIPEDIREWLELMRTSGVAVCLASNTHNRRRLHRMAERLGVPYVQGIPKPRRRCFIRAAEHMCLPAEKVAVVGDQLFTDIWGGKRSGVHTIMVQPVHSREFLGTKVSRLLESRLLAWFHRHNLLPRSPPS